MKTKILHTLAALLVWAGPMLAQTLPKTFVSPYPITDGRFGKSIATLGDRIIVGAPDDTLQGIRTGAAYLIEAATGRTILRFRPRTLTRNANFGFAVATANNHVLVGAPNDEARGVSNAGAAYLFNATTGALEAVIAKVTPATSDSFGFAVAIAGDNLIIGTPRDDAGARDAGAVYMVDIPSAGQGVPRRTVVNPAPGAFDFFGGAVAAIGANFAVGVPSDSPTYPPPFNDVIGDAGSVYLYNNTGERIGTFPNPARSVAIAASFGASLAAFGNGILVGAPTTTILPGVPQVGAVHLIDGSNGSLIYTFSNPTPAVGNRFGDVVAVVGNDILIGAPFDDRDAENAGIAYRFDRAGNQIAEFRNPTPRAGDIFGVVAALGSEVLVGAPGKDVVNSIDAGVVYLFGATPRVSFSSDSLKYGNVLVNANSDLTVRLTNTGTADLSISSTSLAGANANQFSIVTGGGSGTLAPNASRDITLRFSPASVGNKIAYFVLNSNASSSPDTVTLTGSGITTAPTCSLSVISFRDGVQVFDDSVLVIGKISVTDAVPPLRALVTINGISAQVNGLRFSADIPLPNLGGNQFIIAAAIIDSQSDTAVCADTLTVIRAPGAPPKICVDFESLPSGTKYGIVTAGVSDPVGAVIFRENKIPVSIENFRFDSNTTTFGFCRIENASAGFGAGQIIRLDEVSLKLDFTRLGFPVNQITFDCLLASGDIQNIAVNDGVVFIGELSRAPQNIASGVTLTVTESKGVGKATLTGPIRNLLIGGVDDDEFFSLDNICAQDTILCQLVITSPLKGATICRENVQVNAVARLTNVVRPFTIQFDVNSVKAAFDDTILTAKVPLRLGANTLVATATVTDGRGKTTVCVESVAVTRDSIARNVVINEIFSDPNYDDLGAEKIELKNTGSTPVVLDSTMALWIRRGSLDTYWTFRKNRVTLAPNQFFVIHWLARGTNDDAGNVFTGLPTDGGSRANARDGFWGNNSADSTNMTLGGVGNKDAFSIALVQRIAPGAENGFNEPCNLLGFVQICGRVPASESVAVEAGIWRPGFSLDCPDEGNSQNLQPDGSYKPNNPSVGGDSPSTPPPKNHLLITEICVKPENSEFVEIYNPTGAPIDLSNYYLTNLATDSVGYARLVLGTSGSSGFIIQFPTAAVIGPGRFQTIAKEASRFSARYFNAKPTYEIKDTDAGVLNMRIIPRGDTTYRLNDPDGALTLFNWAQNDSSDLVKDVDYAVWGHKEGFVVKKPAFVPFKESIDNPGERALAALEPPEVGINKTGFGIDGPDRNAIRTYYNSETAIRRQKPIANNPHADLKSWQRTSFVEIGEKPFGGNGFAGHDEMSENLAAAFKEDKPTPGTGGKSGPLDGLGNATVKTIEDNPAVDVRLRNVGFPNKIINPGEIVKFNIQLLNKGPLPSGPFFSILRPRNPFVTMIDSTSNFNSIAVGDSGLSLSSYVFEVAKTDLPDSLDFELILIQKSSAPKLNKQAELSAVTVRRTLFSTFAQDITFDITFKFTVDPIRPDSSNLIFDAIIKNVGSLPSNETRVMASRSADTTFIKKVITTQEQNLGTIGTVIGNTRQLNPSKFALVDTFKSQPTSFNLTFSWKHSPTQRLQFTVTMATLMPDTFEVGGKIIYFKDVAKPIPDVIIHLFRRGSSVPLLRDTTDTGGKYSFRLLSGNAGRYKIIASRNGLPSAPNVRIFAPADRDSAHALRSRTASSTRNNEIFKRLAADLNRDSLITNVDTCAIGALAKGLAPNFCASSIRQGWTFVDAITPVKNDKFFRANDTLNLILNNYSATNLNFAGIIYGDVDSSAGRLFRLPPSGGSSESFLTSTTSKPAENIPGNFFLAQNYPNPFNPTTRIQYGLAKEAHVVLQIFNIVGQLVYTGVDAPQKAGYHQIDWAGVDQNGKAIPAGVYLMRLQAGEFLQVRKLLLVK